MYDYNFSVDSNILIMDRTMSTYIRVYLRQIIDKDKGLMVAIKNEAGDYVVEELDSLYYRAKNNLKPSGETKVINGYNCTKYTKSMKDFRADYEYSVWVTTDIKMDDSFNPYMIAAFLKTHLLFPFEGVIVKVEANITQTLQGKREWTSEIVLDTSQLHVKPEKVIWPWKAANPGFGLLQIFDVVPSDDRASIKFRDGDGTSRKQFLRMSTLLMEVTGQEKPKSKQDHVTQIFW